MPLILIGVLLVIAGVVLAATNTIKRGRLSQAPGRGPDEPLDTLEPSGRGRRLSFKADLPGIGLVLIGVVLMFAGAR